VQKRKGGYQLLLLLLLLRRRRRQRRRRRRRRLQVQNTPTVYRYRHSVSPTAHHPKTLGRKVVLTFSQPHFGSKTPRLKTPALWQLWPCVSLLGGYEFHVAHPQAEAAVCACSEVSRPPACICFCSSDAAMFPPSLATKRPPKPNRPQNVSFPSYPMHIASNFHTTPLRWPKLPHHEQRKRSSLLAINQNQQGES
jgi:hypothetical protein